jgi:hypothetical protein
MTLTCTWVNDPAGALVMKWTVDDVPIRQRRNPQNISDGRQVTRRLRCRGQEPRGPLRPATI